MADSDARARAELLRAIAATVSPGVEGVDTAVLHAIAAHMPALLLILDPDGNVLWSNQGRPDVVGHSMYEYMPTGEHATARAALERVVTTGRADRYTGYGIGKRGPSSRWENWVAPIVDGGRVIALAQISRDVSEEWELYETLRDREERLSLVLRAAGMGTWRFDLRSRTVEFDEHARVIYGFPVARLDSLTFTTGHIHADDRVEADRLAINSIATRRPYVAQNRIIRTDGQMRWVEVTGSPMLDDQGNVAALMGTVTDITERRELESRARQAQRLDAVGSLTAGIAHNFNNVLAAIIPALSMIERDVGPRTLPLVRGASLATERAADLVRQLMTFAGRNPSHVRTVESPRSIVERTVALCRSTFDRAIELRVSIEPEVPSIRVDVGQIEQALLNLLLNARDAVGETERSDRRVQVSVSRASLGGVNAVAIVVEDNGPGVPAPLRERIFDPFFTTKPVGAGTGLGLATAYAIVREHGGTLTCDGELGSGARFSVVIPAVDALPEIVETVARPDVRAQGRVLVVDDDPFVRDTVVRVLADAGFAVLGADGADQALRVLAVERAIDVMLLDLNMPGSSWRALVGTMRREHPNTRVVAFTGGLTARDNSVDGWLAKPAAPEAIIDAINHAMDRGRA